MFCYDQWSMIRKHDATGADPDGRRPRAYISKGDGGGGACNSRHRMMLGHPVTMIAQPFGRLSENAGLLQGFACRAALDDWGEVENGEFRHPHQMDREPGISMPRDRAKGT